MRKLTTLAIVGVLALAASTVEAWWCTGHMIIGEIARQNIEYDVEKAVQKQFDFLNQWFPEVDNVVSGACWSDDLKSKHLRDMAGWHFINQVYNPQNVPVTIHNNPLQKNNVASEITMLGETLRDQKWLNEWIRAFATANLVHFVGDIHQPLHATDRFTPEFPEGDRGGNRINVYFPWDTTTPIALHDVWDSVCGQYMSEPYRPLNNTAYEYIKDLADQYSKNFTVPSSESWVHNSTIMAQESFKDAVEYAYVYNTIQENNTLSEGYIANCTKVAGYRLAYAGMRLAHELTYSFGKRHDPEEDHEDAVMKRLVERAKAAQGHK